MKNVKKAFYAFCVAAAICSFAVCGGGRTEKVSVAAETLKTYSTKTVITSQGENGFYYAWGKPDKYVLMTYGGISGGGYSWRAIEPYATVSGSSMHPGNYWGVMVVWVAPESGSVLLDGAMEKVTQNGDGVTAGVYHQKYGGELTVLFERLISAKDELKYEIEQTVTVNKGDTFVFYCDSGNGKDNASDSAGCPFTITYTQSSGDSVKNEDLSRYLSVKSAGEVAGFQRIEQNFEAEVLDGSLTEKTSWSVGCASSTSVLAAAPVALLPLAFIGRKKK